MHTASTVRISMLYLGIFLLRWNQISYSDSMEAPAQISDEIPVYTYTILRTYPHDENAFTQGLVYEDSFLYESTGQYGDSSLRKVEPTTGQVLKIYEMDRRYFGEGIALQGNRIVQVTWQNREGFIYDKETFQPIQTFTYTSEGWGITYDGREFIMSDGTSTLRFLDADTLQTTRTIQVTSQGQPVVRLNELEYVEGEIFANIWFSDRIARINPENGNVTGWIDLSGILPQEDRTPYTNVLNGIAYDAKTGELYVTGKYWPKLFVIEVKKDDSNHSKIYEWTQYRIPQH